MFQKIESLKKEGKIIGFTASTFDLIHAGHCEMLSKAKADCDFLVVGLLTDPTISRPDKKNKPVQTILERFIQLQSIKYVDMIVPFDSEEDLELIIKLINPDIRFVGEEYKGTKHTGWDLCPIKYNDRKHNWGSSQLRKRIYNEELKNQTNGIY
jgi:glycerol-3-phosphate cytidylyltransferase